MKLSQCILLSALACLPAWAGQPLVAVHDSELTRALESQPADGSTPAGTGYQWWPTNWHYFVMPEALKEALNSDGTLHRTVTDAEIAGGGLLDGNGQPEYPIVISLAAEAIAESEIAALTNYVAAGGFLFVGSSAFTRHTNGTARGDFAIAAEMGVHGASVGLDNWLENHTFTKAVEHRLVRHVPGGTLQWRMPVGAEEIAGGISPGHAVNHGHLVWIVTAADASVIARGDDSPCLLAKPFGKGWFIYFAPMQPLIGHTGSAPAMYSYGIIRKAIEWAFQAAKQPVVKLSPWPYQYDAAFMIRHDLGNNQALITNIEASARFEATNGARGEYYFSTGTLRDELTNSATVVAGLRRAVSFWGAVIGAQNGGLPNAGNPLLSRGDSDYWQWGPDEALDLSGTNVPAGYANGRAYAQASISNAFADVESWLSGMTNGLRHFVAPYWNGNREQSHQISGALGLSTSGEQKIGPFPSWVLSTASAGQRYACLSLPVSDWFYSTDVPESMDAGHFRGSMHDLVDSYYNLGGLINLSSHSLSTGDGPAGAMASDYVTYGMNTNLHPRVWPTTSAGVYSWWLQRSNAHVSATTQLVNNRTVTAITVSRASASATGVELLAPTQTITDLQVLTNGVAAAPPAYRVQNGVIKVLTGTGVTNVQVSFLEGPQAADDNYTCAPASPLAIAAPGVLANDTIGAGTNLTALLLAGPAHGSLVLNTDGSFNYTPSNDFSGIDAFTYVANDGLTNSAAAVVRVDVAAPGTVFYDDFTRGPNGSALAPWIEGLGHWTVADGVLEGTSSGSDDYAEAYVPGNWGDFSVQARVQLPLHAWAGGLSGRVNPVTGARYTANIYPEESPLGPSKLRVMKFSGWRAWNLMTVVDLPGVGTNWHTLKITFAGPRITVYYDGAQVAEVTDQGQYDINPPYLSGTVSAHMYMSAPFVASFDDVIVIPGAPSASADSYRTVANRVLNIPPPGVLANDDPGAGLFLKAELRDPPQHGALSLHQDGSFQYTPAPNYYGPDSFTYVANNGSNSGPAVVSLTVIPILAQDDEYSYATDTPLNVPAPGVLANDLVGTDSATVELISGPTHGSLVLATNGGFTYDPETNFFGLDGFLYRAHDGLGNMSTASVRLTNPTALFADDFLRTPDPAPLSPWIVGRGSWTMSGGVLNGGPNSSYGYGDIYSSDAWTNYSVQARLRFPVGAYFRGGGMLGRLNAATGARYALWLYPPQTPGNLTTVQLLKFSNWDSFSYLPSASVPDVGGDWHKLQMTFVSNRIIVWFDGIEVINTADETPEPLVSGVIGFELGTSETPYAMSIDDVVVAPLAIDDNYTMAGNRTLSVPAPGLLRNDTQLSGGAETVSLAAGPAHGALTLNADGSFSYTPLWNFAGSDSFSYTVTQGPTVLGTATVTINVQSLPILTVTSDNKSRIYGETNPPLTGTISGLIAGDNITPAYTTPAVSNSPAGTYPIQVLLHDPQGKLNNYFVVTNSGTLTVTPAMLTVRADSHLRAYGSTNPELTVSYSGFVNGEDATVLGGSPQLSTIAGTNSPVGAYPIVITQGTLATSNYSLLLTNGVLTVGPADLLVRADDMSRVYGRTNPVLTVSYSGFVNGEGATVLSGSLTLSTPAETNSPVGQYPIALSPGTLVGTNYNLLLTNGILSVTPAELVVRADDKSRTYGVTNPVLTVSYSGFVNGEDSSALVGRPDVSTPALTSSPVGEYPIALERGTLSSTNYSIVLTNGTLAITPAELVGQADDKARLYGATNPVLTATFTGFVNGEDATVLSGAPELTTAATAASGAGNYPILLTQGTLTSSNYTIAFTNGVLRVTPAPLIIRAEDKSKPYSAPNPVLSAVYSGLVNGEDASVLTGAPQLTTDAVQFSPVGSYAIAASQGTLQSSNYTFAFSPGTLTVEAASIAGTVTGPTNATVYLEPVTLRMFVAAVSPATAIPMGNAQLLVNGVSQWQGLLWNGQADFFISDLPPGTNTLTAVYLGNERFRGVTNSLVHVVLPTPQPQHPLVITNNGDGTVSVAYLGDPGRRYIFEATAVLAPAAWAAVSTNTADANGLVAMTEPVSQQSRFYRVLETAPVLMINVISQTRLYGDTNPPLAGTVTGLLPGDHLAISYITTAETNSAVGSYPIAPVFDDPAGRLTNYTVVTNLGTLTVLPAPLEVSPNKATRLYGATNPVLSGTITGLRNGDPISASYSSAATTNSPVGTYPIEATISDPLAKLGNYSLVTLPASLDVLPVELLVRADHKSRPYGATNPVLTVTYEGFVNGEEPTVLTGSPDLSTPATTNSPVGQYPITVGQGTLASTNYSFILTNGVLTVLPTELIVRAEDKSRPYGATNPVLTVTYEGFVNGEGATVLTGSPDLSTSATTNSPVGQYPITAGQGTLASTNYSFLLTNGVLTVLPTELIVRAEDKSRPSGTTNPVLTVRYSGFVNGEDATVLSGAPDLSTTANIDSALGDYPIVVTQGTLASTNYSFLFTNGILSVTAPLNPGPAVTSLRIQKNGDGTVTLNYRGRVSWPYWLEAADIINASAWFPIQTNNSAADGTGQFIDLMNRPSRFYKVVPAQ